MEDECHGSGDSCAVAMAIRELAAAVQATVPEPPADPDALLTAEEVGELLQLSPRTLKDQAAAGCCRITGSGSTTGSPGAMSPRSCGSAPRR
jgi:hypothetical protein